MPTTLHTREREQFKKLFKQEEIDDFADRYTVLEVFLATEHHVTPMELTRLLAQQGHYLEPDFVHETLRLMCRFGFARRVRFADGRYRYEHLHLGQHHDHMICTKCKSIFEFEDRTLEKLQAKIANSYGFHMLQHRMEIYGICQECMARRDHHIPLIKAKVGEELVIKEIMGGSGARMRLMAMGLRVGDRVRVLTNIADQQIAVAVDYNRYVLGRGLARKIVVEPHQGENSEFAPK